MFRKITLSFLLATSVVLTGCSSHEMHAVQNLPCYTKPQSFCVQKVEDNCLVDQDISKKFDSYLRERLFKSEEFPQGNDITISYKFVNLCEGSRLTRYLVGAISKAGEGKAIVEFTFRDGKTGKVLGVLQGKSSISFGFFGGSFQSAIEEIVEDLISYMSLKFPKKS